MTLDEIRAALARLSDMDMLRAALLQEEAKVLDGLPMTPIKALEVLREHALGCVDRRDPFAMVVEGNLVTAEWDGYKLGWFLGIKGGTGYYEHYTTATDLKDRVSAATMFATNVGSK